MERRKPFKSNIRKELLARTHCANHPQFPATGCKDYICPLWKCNNGLFDESGKEIDHIVEITQGGSNDISNLQVLCACCHSVKTKRCAKQNWNYNSIEIDSGVGRMEIENKKRK
jgi:5-methylcytosine-specific restriction endonuclease McrA